MSGKRCRRVSKYGRMSANPLRSVWRSKLNRLVRGMLLSVAPLMMPVMPASAEASATDAIQRYRLGDPAMFAFFAGNLNGLIWANAELQSGGHTRLFCVPSDEDLNVPRLVELTARHLEGAAADGARPIGSVMLQSLKEAFPCK